MYISYKYINFLYRESLKLPVGHDTTFVRLIVVLTILPKEPYTFSSSILEDLFLPARTQRCLFIEKKKN